MEIKDIKKYEPIFGEYYIKRKIGEGTYGAVFEIQRTVNGRIEDAALKVVSIPKDQDAVKSVILQGGDPKTYCDSLVSTFENEARLLSKLKGNINIVNYENHRFMPNPNGIGGDLLMQMEFLMPLTEYLKVANITEKLAIDIGISMCDALEVCHKNGIIHRDVKPENIFISREGYVKLGDFGVSKMKVGQYAGTKVGSPAYMAPEIFHGKQYDDTVDLYSLGLVLYTMTNMFRMPFEGENSTHSERTIANSKRTSGLPIPPPMNASEQLSSVILKACEAAPANRFQSASEMRNALYAVKNVTYVVPKQVPHEPIEKEPLEKTPEPPKQRTEKPKKSKVKLIIGIAAAVIAVILIVSIIGELI